MTDLKLAFLRAALLERQLRDGELPVIEVHLIGDGVTDNRPLIAAAMRSLPDGGTIRLRLSR